MLISQIAVMARNRVIGAHGTMPWHLTDDLRRFRCLTMGCPLLMGRRTFHAIGRPLPGRRTIVVSRRPEDRVPGCDTVDSISAGLVLARPADELFICGGAEIFHQTQELVERIYLTTLDAEIDGDRFFPKISDENFQILLTRRYNETQPMTLTILQRTGVGAALRTEAEECL